MQQRVIWLAVAVHPEMMKKHHQLSMLARMLTYRCHKARGLCQYGPEPCEKASSPISGALPVLDVEGYRWHRCSGSEAMVRGKIAKMVPRGPWDVATYLVIGPLMVQSHWRLAATVMWSQRDPMLPRLPMNQAMQAVKRRRRGHVVELPEH